MQNRFQELKVKVVYGAAIISIVFVFLFAFSRYVPFNMDEFLAYQALTCQEYPFNKLNIFRENCRGHELAIISQHYWPLRSFQYTGSFPALVYFPFFKIWPSPYSARLIGVLLLLVQSFLLSRLFKVRVLPTFCLLLLFFPYAFQHVVDYGPVALQITSVFLICYLMKQWMSLAGKGQLLWRYPLMIGLILFVGVWIKISYFFLLPAIALQIIYFIVEQRQVLFSRTNKIKILLQGALLALTAGLPIGLLLNARDHWDSHYYRWITSSPKASLSDMSNFLVLQKKILPYLLNPIRACHFLFDVPEQSWSTEGILWALCVVVFVGYGFLYFKKRPMKMSFALFNVFLFIMTLGLMSFSLSVYGMHHVVLSFPFLILALFEIGAHIRKKWITAAVLSVFILTNVSLYHQLSKLPYQQRNHPSLLALNQFVNKRFGDGYVFIVLDWGMYYIKALYGNKNQCVLWEDSTVILPKQAELLSILRKTNRKPVFLARKDLPTTQLLSPEIFPDFTMADPGIDTPWGVWYLE